MMWFCPCVHENAPSMKSAVIGNENSKAAEFLALKKALLFTN